uniref:Putative DNA binding, helix-turn-helix domain containing protein n=1 Tax=viral metagenome TaxID=1070528 RepID=A0A6H1Z9E4_9ZZZZ
MTKKTQTILLGEYLRQVRESKGLSIGELSRLMGVGKPFLSRVERSLKVPSWLLLETWAMVLDAPIDDELVRLWMDSRRRIIFNLGGLTVSQVKLLLLLERRIHQVPMSLAHQLAQQVLEVPQ